MPRVLYAAFDVVPSPKGASTHITHFVRGLANAGYDVHLITAGDGLLPAQDEYAGAAMTRVPPAAEEHFLSRAVDFSRAVAEHIESAPPYQVAHFRSIWGGLALDQTRTRLGHRALFEVNGLPSVELKYHYPALREAAPGPLTDLLAKIREQEIAALQLSDAIICPSSVTRAYIASLGVPRERVSVIPNGVSPDEFAAMPLPPPNGRPPSLVYIGTLADWQGLELLVAAMPHVLAVRPVCLRIVGRGRGRQRKTLARQIRKLGLEAHVSVEAALPHHEVPALLAQADVCVAPLALNDRNVTQGCCPLKVLESMAAGRPLVAANLPVVRELAREDVDALLFAPDSPEDLARQLLRVLADRGLAERLAASAAQRARTTFTWHNAQKKLLRVYQRLIDSGRVPH